jgi:hypothetical protein
MKRARELVLWCVLAGGTQSAASGCLQDLADALEDEPRQTELPNAGRGGFAPIPGLSDLTPGWTAIEPGGETTCARGTPFRFFARRGSVNNLAIVFDGGGACWNATTCGFADALFSPEADDNLPERLEGIADDSAENPLRDWHAVFVPYCTGDVHWGDNVARYGSQDGAPPITIHHKGRINAEAALDWVYANFERPETILVTGFSAGAYGSIAHAPYVMEHYPDSRVVQLGDSGAGVITETFFADSFPSWHAEQVFPSWIEGLQRPIDELAFEDIYIEIGNYYPDRVVSQYTTYNDETQRFFYTAMGGMDEDWSPEMIDKIETIERRTPNFRYYIAWGDKHVILTYPEFYRYQVNGVRMRDWLASLLAGDDVENVRCVDCASQELFGP